MSEVAELLKSFDELQRTIAARDDYNAKFQEELKTFSGVTTETAKRLAEIEEVVNKLADTLTDLKKQAERPRFDPSDLKQGTELERKHCEAYLDWMRKGRGAEPALFAVEKEWDEHIKAVTGISDTGGTAGGHGVPEILARQILARTEPSRKRTA